MRALVLTPLKPPDHPEPSGDREMARLLTKALALSGIEPVQASRLRMLDRTGDPGLTRRLATAARTEADAIMAAERALPQARRARLVFTYHVHYKAPDVIGPAVAQALGLPYVVAEGSRAPKRADGPWAEGHRLAEAALDAADLVLVLNGRDREVLERLRPPGQRLEELPPFVDAAAWPDLSGDRPPADPARPARLVCVAMMRPGDKLASYALLADALGRLRNPGWALDVVGAGAAEGEVRALLGRFGTRVTWLGRVEDRHELARLYAAADLLVWPAVNEAFGMVLLEAALQGCPALAGRFGGVPDLIHDGETGRVVPPHDAAAFAAALDILLADRASLAGLGTTAARRVRAERTLEAAAGRLSQLLAPLLARAGAAA